MNNRTEKWIGILLILGSVLLLIPYTILTITFDYPDILREEAGFILTLFQKGGNSLILTWWAFAMIGIPLIPAYILLGQKLEEKDSTARVATTFGLIGLVVQIVGLLRWTFIVPVLASNYVSGTEIEQQSAIITFQTIHQYGGVVLGEHLGQIFTIVWTVWITMIFYKIKLFPNWVNVLAYTSATIYILAQAEIFSTVIPDFPYWGYAGFLGSTLWLIWMIIIGVFLLRRKIE